MRITSDKIEISPNKSVGWEEVKALRLLNDRFIVVLQDDSTIELGHLRHSTIDTAFRTYERFLKAHPELKRKQPRRPA